MRAWTWFSAKVAPVLTSLTRSFLLGMLVLIMNNGWGVIDSAANWEAILNAGYAAFGLTAYLYLDKGFTAYGVGAKDRDAFVLPRQVG